MISHHVVSILHGQKIEIMIKELILCLWYTNTYLCLCMRFVCVRSKLVLCTGTNMWVLTQFLVSEKRSDWLTPWWVVPSRGKNYYVDNKYTMESIYYPTPRHERRCRSSRLVWCKPMWDRFLSHCLLSVAILARWWWPVLSVEAVNLLYWVMCMLLYRCIAMASKTAAAGVIRSKYSFDGGIKLLLVKLWTYDIWQFTRHYSGASTGPSKWVLTEVFFCRIIDFDIVITVAYYHSNREYKLKLIRRHIYLYVIRWMLWFGQSPMTMDAMLATIVLNRQQLILNNERLIEIN